MDPKGRIALPGRFRKVIDAKYGDKQLVVTKHPTDPCLVVYPLKEWERFEAKLDTLPKFNKKAKILRRILIGCAQDCVLDKQGRLLIPPELREAIGTDAIWKGQGSFAELWSKDRYDSDVVTEIEALAAGDRPELEAELEELGI